MTAPPLLLVLLLSTCPLPTTPEPMSLSARQRPVTRAGFTVEIKPDSVTVRGAAPLYTVGFDRSWFRPCYTTAGVCTVRRSQGRVSVWAGGASGEPQWQEGGHE